MTDYNKQANNFLKQTKTTLKIKKHPNQSPPPWYKPGEKYGYKYKVTLENKKYSYTFPFWDSIANREKEENGKALINGETITIKPFYGRPYELKNTMHTCCRGDITKEQAREEIKELIEYAKNPTSPTAYTILACLESCSPGTFEEFCDSFGYDNDSITANNIYKAVVNQFFELERLFTPEELEQLQEIN
jgi:hypothetical protein